MSQEKLISQIVDDLQQLPEHYLKNIYKVVHLLRTRLPEDTAQHEPPPFVDETERVKEQTRDLPEQGKDDRHFT